MGAGNEVSTTGVSTRWWVNWRNWGGVAALGVAIIGAVSLSQATPRLAVFWLFGLSFGFIMQRSRFCFAAAFRNLFLLRDGRVMKGVLAGLTVATVGFALVMYDLVPNNLDLGIRPFNAYVLPLGLHILLAGVLFGVGMVVAGSCFPGALWRIGEGYITAVAILFSFLLGIGLFFYHWDWWWGNYISQMPYVWLPHSLGWAGALLLTLTVLAIGYLLIHWWESGVKSAAKPACTRWRITTIRHKLGSLKRGVFTRAWPIALAGIILAVLNILLYLFERPWGTTGEVGRWSIGLLNLVQLPLPDITTLPGSCIVPSLDSGLLTWGLMLNGGMIFGGFIGALLAGEFKLRLPRQKRRYLQAFAGGLLMGYGAGLAGGCAIGSFFSAVPSLGLNGFVFGGALVVGAFLGVQVIKRIR